MEEKEEELNDS